MSLGSSTGLAKTRTSDLQPSGSELKVFLHWRETQWLPPMQQYSSGTWATGRVGNVSSEPRSHPHHRTHRSTISSTCICAPEHCLKAGVQGEFPSKNNISAIIPPRPMTVRAQARGPNTRSISEVSIPFTTATEAEGHVQMVPFHQCLLSPEGPGFLPPGVCVSSHLNPLDMRSQQERRVSPPREQNWIQHKVDMTMLCGPPKLNRA